MQAIFELGPDDWTENFWKKLIPLFSKRKVRVIVEEMEVPAQTSQYDSYLAIKKLQGDFPPVKVDANIDLSNLANESNNTPF